MDMVRMLKSQSRFTGTAVCTLALSILGGCQGDLPDGALSPATSATALGTGPAQLRELIARQVGGLDKLQVPGDDTSIPLPPEDPARPGRYKTTEAKRFLGKMLFHDPVRTA